MTIRELVTKIGFDVSEKDVKNVENRTKKMSLGLKATIAGVVAGIGMIGKSSIAAAADMEMLETQFEVMLGSSEKAKEMMEELAVVSAGTPFQLPTLAQGTQNLISFGVESENAIDVLKMLGDTASGDQEKLASLVLAYGKVTVKGKASMEELNMIAERGIPIFKTLADQYGVTQEELIKMSSKGQISAEAMEQAFRTLTAEGGMFYQGMLKQSKTLLGVWSTLKDNFFLMLAEVGKDLLPIAKELAGVLIELVQGPLKDLVKSLMSALIPIIKLLISLLMPIVSALIPVFQVLVPIIKIFTDLLMWALKPILELITPLVKLLADVLWLLMPALKLFFWFLKIGFTPLKWFVQALSWALEVFQKFTNWLLSIGWIAKLVGKGGAVDPSVSQSMEKGATNPMTNININSNVGIQAGGSIQDPTSVKRMHGDAAKAAFSIEISRAMIKQAV